MGLGPSPYINLQDPQLMVEYLYFIYQAFFRLVSSVDRTAC